jgi:hypothetical protein
MTRRSDLTFLLSPAEISKCMNHLTDQRQALPLSPWKGYLGPIPGAYHVVAGTLPIPEATEEELRLSARNALEKLDPPMAYLTKGATGA